MIKSLLDFWQFFLKKRIRMSLVSASGFIGGIKEYMYRGFQQLPIVLATTSMIFTITTGSIAHANLAGGLIFIIPFYTWSLQQIFGLIFNRFRPNTLDWTRNTDDSCNIMKSSDIKKLGIFDKNNRSSESVPSYWLMSIGFFIGYGISNAVDSLLSPSESNADSTHIEKRKSQAVYTIAALSVLCVAILFMRFSMMRDCEGQGLEGRGWVGLTLSVLCAIGAACIGKGIYDVSRKCGSRASDLFGILSQILPPSSMTSHPIVCTETD